MNDIWGYSFLGNSVKGWAIFVGVFIACFVAVKIFEYVLIRFLKQWSKRTTTTLDDFLVEAVESSVVPFLYFLSAYYASSFLNVSPRVSRITEVAILFIGTFYILRIITSAIKYLVYSFLDKQEDSEVKKKQARGILIIVNVAIWLVGFVFLLDNLGHDVTTIIAGLGVGGIAIALAAQTILGDLFSYFVIFFDRPFEIGDFIVVGSESGVVEYVGVKTTRIRTLTGDLLVCANTDLTNSRIHNFKKLERRRIVFKIGVTYDTPHEKLSNIPTIIKDIIESIEGITFDRSHFSSYGDFSLNFESVYYVEDPDYAIYMDKQHQLYLDLYKKFSEQEIEFAFPTQTLHVNRLDNDDNPKEELVEK